MAHNNPNFDWDEWNRRFDEKLAELDRTIALMNSIERSIYDAHTSMIADVRKLITIEE